MRAALVLVVFLLAVPFAHPAPMAAEQEGPDPVRPRFTSTDDAPATEGHAVVSWTVTSDVDPADDLVFELHRSREPDFGNHQVLHTGPETAVFVSGLNQGGNYFRVRALQGGTPGPWSDSLLIQVEYPGRGQVVVLLVVGCLVFLSTVVAIVLGWMRYRQPAPAASRA